MFTEPTIPKPPPAIRELTGTEAIAFFHSVAMGKLRIDETEGISSRKDPDGTFEHLIRFHTPIRIVHPNRSMDAMAVLVTKIPSGSVTAWWYDDAKEGEMEWDNRTEDDE